MWKFCESVRANGVVASIDVIASGYDPFEWFAEHYPEVSFISDQDSKSESELIGSYLSEYADYYGDTDYIVILNDKTRFNSQSIDEFEYYINIMRAKGIDTLNCRHSSKLKLANNLAWMIKDPSDILQRSSALIISAAQLFNLSMDELRNSANYLQYIFSQGHMCAEGIVTTKSALKLKPTEEIIPSNSHTYLPKSDSLAVVTFTPMYKGIINGLSVSAEYLANQFKEHFATVDLVYLGQEVVPYGSQVLQTSDWRYLNQYTSIIFISPGLTNEKPSVQSQSFYEKISQVERPFSFVVHGERYTELHPYIDYFLDHPKFTYVIYNCEGLIQLFPEYTPLLKPPVVVPITPEMLDKSDILEKAKAKSSKTITATCRWIPRKRIFELLELSDKLYANGFQVNIEGAQSSTFYVKKIKDKLITKGVTTHAHINKDKLGYTPEQLPNILKECMYHYNLVYSIKFKEEIIQPRIELATLEAINEGCLPILSEETTPDWLGYDSAIRISKSQLKELPQILNRITEEERLARLSKLRDLVQVNILDKYESISQTIKELVKEA